MQPQSSLQLRRGVGVEGDINAAVGSPRQVLLVGANALRAFDLLPGQLRENIVLDGDVELFQSGQVLQLGDALIRLTFWCEPCSFINTIRPGLAGQIKRHRGYLGLVVQSGEVLSGAQAHLMAPRFPAIPERNGDRLADFVSRIERGRVVRMADLLLALGWTTSYYRAIPALIKKMPADLPVHRIVANDYRLLLKHLPDQAQALLQEGVVAINGRVPADCQWEPWKFYDTEIDSSPTNVTPV